jgi:hypothetical protein
MQPTRYLAVWSLALAGLLLTCAAVNVLIDPYHVFGSERRPGINARKTEASSYTPLVKAAQIERIKPALVLLGTSRVDIGLDPQHAAWSAASKPVYNYGLPEASILTLQRQLDHALAAGPVRSVVIGLEFQDFLRARLDPEAVPDEVERRFVALSSHGASWARTQQRAIDSASATLTLGALLSSASTLASQRAARAGDVTDLGLTSEAPYAELVRRDGYHDLFEQKNLGVVQARQTAARRFAAEAEPVFVELAHLQRLMEFCRTHGIGLQLFVPPYHAHFLEIIDATGLWGRFEHWKRTLAAAVDAHRTRTGANVTLWDFAVYSEHTTEAVPRKGDVRGQMQWFWEPLHFKRALGDIVVARMAGQSQVPFGARLEPALVEDHLRAERERRAEYRRVRAGEVRALHALAAPKKTPH